MTSVENILEPLKSVEVTAGPASLTTQHGALLPCPTGPAALAPPALLLQPAEICITVLCMERVLPPVTT